MNDANTRGEVTITLDGAEYVMRPSYEAIEAIEAQTGKSVIELLVEADSGKLHLSDAGVVVWECIKAWGRQCVAAGDADPIAKSAAGANLEKVRKLIYKFGIHQTRQRIAILLMAAATGGVTETGELVAVASTLEAAAD
jgi:hypothetical protein